MVQHMENNFKHEIVANNPDIDVRFYLSKDEGSYVSPHWHNSLEIVYVISGKVTLNLPKGVKQTACDGEFFLANPREIHSVLSEKNEALVLQIPQKFYEKYAPSMALRKFAVDMTPTTDVGKTRLERLKKIFLDMYVVYDVRPEGYLLRFNSLLYELLFSLIHYHSEKIMQKDFDRDNKYFSRLKEIMKYINENHSRPISVSDIAKKFSYNPDYLARFFKKYMNCTVTDYIYSVRVACVHLDLVNTDLPIGEILEEHGCTNHSLFMKYFREQWGCSPKEHRKNYVHQNIKIVSSEGTVSI